MHKPKISIVIVSWNTKAVTDECLFCVKKSVDYAKDNADTEVIVVDNASTDGSPEMIEKKYPWVKLVKETSNLGYAKGNNLGFKKTTTGGNYLLLMNSDVYLEKETLVNSLNYFEKNNECDVLGCKLVLGNGKLQPSAGNLPTPASVWSWIWGIDLIPGINKLISQFHPRDKEYFKNDRRVGWVQGAFLFMKREVFEKTNGFDEKFFMYMDEVEWCRRVQKLDYKIFYTPDFSVTHLDRASAQGIPEKLAKTYSLEVIGLIYYLRKYYPNNLGILLPLIKFGVFLRWFAFLLLGNKTRTQAYSTILKEI